ncbi:MAG: 50S ribosomal protein L1 [Candidatus Aenigmarchaeota archaeon]|nr:50S ribosomal protein L1 [Candidatus Aenigmarchaeota archaeon]
MAQEILEAIKMLREDPKKKKFSQSFDLSVNISNIDLKKPESKFVKDVSLPHGKGRPNKTCVISQKGDVTKDDLLKMENDKKAAKILGKSYDFFLAEAPLMVLVGKVLGRYLGPTGKMPKLLPPNVDPENMKKALEKSIRIKIKDTPVIHCIVGNEKMSDEQIKENVEKVIEEVRKAIPPKSDIKNTYLKLTMSKPIAINVGLKQN